MDGLAGARGAIAEGLRALITPQLAETERAGDGAGSGAGTPEQPLWRVAESAVLGAGEGVATLRGAVAPSAVQETDFGALFTSSCDNCAGACTGHSVDMSATLGSSARTAGNATPEQFARYLTTGFWKEKGEPVHSWNTDKDNVLTVNLSGVTAEMKVMIRAALEAWETVADIEFREVRGKADIRFSKDWSKATTDAIYYANGPQKGEMVEAIVKVGQGYVDRNGKTLGSSSMQTYIHEIGHALGIGHPGGYGLKGGTLFANDSWQMSVMSYTPQGSIKALGADSAVAITPMMADIIAIQALYGKARGGPTAGETVYGKGATLDTYLDLVFAGKGASLSTNAITIFDESGRDRIDFSADTAAQRVDLNGGAHSDVFGKKGNLSIAKGTVIENYAAGSGSDRVTGNAVGNSLWGNAGHDTLWGRDGNDAIRGGAGNDSAYGGNGADRILGEAGNDVLYGDGGRDTLSGGNDLDRLFGGADNDRLDGGSGNDTLDGGSGNDSLVGGGGDDTLTGGAGADRFVFGRGAGWDVVRDFQDNLDEIVIPTAMLSSPTMTVAQVLAAHATVTAGGVVLDFGGGDRMTIEGLTNVNVLMDDIVLT